MARLMERRMGRRLAQRLAARFTPDGSGDSSVDSALAQPIMVLQASSAEGRATRAFALIQQTIHALAVFFEVTVGCLSGQTPPETRGQCRCDCCDDRQEFQTLKKRPVDSSERRSDTHAEWRKSSTEYHGGISTSHSAGYGENAGCG